MNTKITRIAISGAMGRMGQELIKSIQKNKNACLTTALVKKNHPFVNQDIGEKIGIGKIGILISDTLNIQKSNFDVLIDFTNPNGTLHYLCDCKKFKKNIIIGTTGFSDQEINKIKLYSKKIAVVMSSNFSTGINLLYELVQKATRVMGKNSDIDIVEFHHRNKIDIPSGTALTIGEKIAQIMQWDIHKHSLYYTKGIQNHRKRDKIGFSSIRSGKTIGKHTAIFSNSYEEIKITHTAFNRSSFSEGAIQAAIWIDSKKHGLFNMQDVLKKNNLN